MKTKPFNIVKKGSKTKFFWCGELFKTKRQAINALIAYYKDDFGSDFGDKLAQSHKNITNLLNYLLSLGDWEIYRK